MGSRVSGAAGPCALNTSCAQQQKHRARAPSAPLPVKLWGWWWKPGLRWWRIWWWWWSPEWGACSLPHAPDLFLFSFYISRTAREPVSCHHYTHQSPVTLRVRVDIRAPDVGVLCAAVSTDTKSRTLWLSWSELFWTQEAESVHWLYTKVLILNLMSLFWEIIWLLWYKTDKWSEFYSQQCFSS